MSVVNAPGEALAEMNAREAQFDIEALFRTHYRRVARMIARVVRDPARAEELAVELFLKLWRNSSPPGHHVEGWLYRVALRAGLDELRRESRRARYARLLSLAHSTPSPSTPEQLHSAAEQQETRSLGSECPSTASSRISCASEPWLQLRRAGPHVEHQSLFCRHTSQPRSAILPKGVIKRFGQE